MTLYEWLIIATVLGAVLVLARMLMRRDRERAQEDAAARAASRCERCGRSDKP